MAFGWAIIGAGMHPDLKVAPAITAAAGGELVSIFSRNQGRAEAFAEKHGASAAHDNLEDLLSDSRVDGVFVASPNSLHSQHTVLEAGGVWHNDLRSERAPFTALRCNIRDNVKTDLG